MAASIAIELDSGTCAGNAHPHNGYYAGDFDALRHVAPAAWHAPVATSTTRGVAIVEHPS